MTNIKKTEKISYGVAIFILAMGIFFAQNVSATPPTITFSANPTSVPYKGSSTLAWSLTDTNPITVCTLSSELPNGFISGSFGNISPPPTSKSEAVPSITSPMTFKIYCFNGLGENDWAVATASIDISCPSPEVYSSATGTCVTPLVCASPKVYSPAVNTCVLPLACTSPQVYSSAVNACITPPSCPSSQIYNSFANKCVNSVACPYPKVYNPATGTCDTEISVSTSDAKDITQTTAVLHGIGGYVDSSTSTLPLTAYFRYSKAKISPIYCNDIYGTNMMATGDIKTDDNGASLGATSSQPFSTKITGLSPNTTYYYCAIISNSLNIAYGGSSIVKSFRTNCYDTTVQTNPATTIGSDSAVLNGYYCSPNVNTDGTTNKSVETYFEYQELSNYGGSVPFWTLVPGSEQNFDMNDYSNLYGNIKFNLSGLTPNAEYQFRSVVKNNPNTTEEMVYRANNPLKFTTVKIAGQDVNSGSSDTTGDYVPITYNTYSSPYVTLYANSNSDGSSTLTWYSANTTSCQGTNFDTHSATNNNTGIMVTPSVNTTYSIKCFSANGTASASVIGSGNSGITSSPTINLQASPAPVSPGSSSTITWSTINATACTAQSPYTLQGKNSTGDSITTGALKSPTTFSINCTGPGGSASNSITVTISSGSNLNNSICLYGGTSPDCYGPSTPDPSNPNNSPVCTYGGTYPVCNGPSTGETCTYGGVYPFCYGPNNSNNFSGGISNGYTGSTGSNSSSNRIISTSNATSLVLGQTATPPVDDVVHYHEGIETVFTRQIMADAAFAKMYGYRDGADLQTFAWDLADQLARAFGYVSPNGEEIRVSLPDVAAYQLQQVGDKLTVYEYYNNKIVDVRNLTTVFKTASGYEYYFKK